MPRAKRPPGPANQGGYQGGGDPGGGASAQPARAATGLPYGEHQALVRSQQQIPLPASPALPAGPPSSPPAGAPVAAGNLPDASIGAALGMIPPSSPGLLGPSQRPQEPVTAGLPSGPGPGPEVVGPPPVPTLADRMDAIAQANGDPQLAQLAQLARTLGGPGA